MTENTEILKSLKYSTDQQAKYQDEILKTKIGEQGELINKLTKVIADSQFELNLAVQYKELLISQLSPKSEASNNGNSLIPKTVQQPPQSNPRNQHRNYQKRLILEVLKEHSTTALASNGLRIPDIKSLIHEKDENLRISPNTIGHLIDEEKIADQQRVLH